MTHEPMKTEDIINALAKPLGAAALNQRGYPADIATVIDKAIKGLNLLNEHRFATNWSLSELRDLFGEYGAPAGDRGAVRPAQFAAWVVGLVRRLQDKTEDTLINTVAEALDAAETENCKLEERCQWLDASCTELRRQRDAAETERSSLHKEIVSRDKAIAELEARLEKQAQPAATPPQVVLWNQPEQFGLPSGYTINNPDNLSPDQIGEGYRIATTVDDTDLPHDFLSEDSSHWISAWRTRGTFAVYPHHTYRVPADRPLPPLENDKP